MDAARAARLTGAALRCYPARWRRRHGAEAAELAALLIRDGTPAVTVALSYLAGAARERLTPRPGRARLAGALLACACVLGLSAGLLASAGPARAAAPGRPPGGAHCRPAPAAVPVQAPGHPRLVTREAGHGRPC